MMWFYDVTMTWGNDHFVQSKTNGRGLDGSRGGLGGSQSPPPVGIQFVLLCFLFNFNSTVHPTPNPDSPPPPGECQPPPPPVEYLASDITCLFVHQSRSLKRHYQHSPRNIMLTWSLVSKLMPYSTAVEGFQGERCVACLPQWVVC